MGSWFSIPSLVLMLSLPLLTFCCLQKSTNFHLIQNPLAVEAIMNDLSKKQGWRLSSCFHIRHPQFHISSTKGNASQLYGKHKMDSSPPAWEILVLSEHCDQRWGDRLGNGGPRMEAATWEAEAWETSSSLVDELGITVAREIQSSHSLQGWPRRQGSNHPITMINMKFATMSCYSHAYFSHHLFCR